MVFSSTVFLCVFLPVTFVLYSILPTIKIKNILLIFVSLFFYAYGEPVYIILMLISTVINYFFGLVLDRKKNNILLTKSFLVISVVFNLLILGVFKYTDMILDLINNALGIYIKSPEIVLPIGISFYTFQAMSYVIDIYRGNVKAQKNYLNVLLYISFFPQLIAGPIIKYHDMENQINERSISIEKISRGLARFIVGLSKKILISNVMALAADNIFALDLYQINIFGAWIGAISYMLQIYYDFSGYSDMAIGLGLMFGFEFNENFNYPYSSLSIKDFWRRWHISLSTWFKEYLYIPMGGNRKGRARSWLNRMIVFFCTGLWHGANWTFVLWGLYHGALLFIEDVVRIMNIKIAFPKLIKRLYTLLAVCIGFVMFRADTVAQGFAIIGKMFTGWNMNSEVIGYALRQCTPLFIFTLVLAIIGQFPWLKVLEQRISDSESKNRFETVGFGLCILLLLLCMLSLSSGSYNPFIYFRF